MPRKCCVPGCRGNYDVSEKISVFKFPTDPYSRNTWVKKIPRADFQPTSQSVVCAKHFSEQCIIRVDSVTRPDGSVLTIKRTKPKLTDDAYPTIFPNCFLITKATRRRNEVLPRILPKIPTFNTHSKPFGAEDNRTIFCQNHLALPASSVLLHDYDSRVDSFMVADSTDNQGAIVKEANSTQTVTQQSQQQPIRRTRSQRQSELIRDNATSETVTVIRPHQQYVRRKETRSQSKLSSQKSDQAETGTSANSRQESTEPELMSNVKVEIDIAEDPTDFLRDSSPSSAQYYHRSIIPCVQLIKMEPEDESNCHSTQYKEEAASNQLHVTNKFKTEVKQEKEDSLSSCHTPFSNKQIHMSHNAMEIKQEIDMDVCGYSEDVSTGQYNADAFGMEIQKKKEGERY